VSIDEPATVGSKYAIALWSLAIRLRLPTLVGFNERAGLFFRLESKRTGPRRFWLSWFPMESHREY
jgi:hypothetical protein